jgi:hypothetical protein
MGVNTNISVVICMISTSHSAEQHSSNLSYMANTLRGDVRLISIGDSYSAPYYSRIVPAGLRVWPIPHIEGVCNGADSAFAVIRCLDKCDPVSTIMAADSEGYAIEREGTDLQYFGLPILGMKEIFTDSNFYPDSNGNLFEFNLNVDELDSSVHGAFSHPDETLHFRLLYRSPSDFLNQPSSFLIESNQAKTTTFNPVKQARKFYHLNQQPDGFGRDAVASQINASAFDITLTYDQNNLYKVRLLEDAALQGTNHFFDLAGAVYRKTNSDGSSCNGLYFTSIGDGSWSYVGYGSNEECNAAFDKTFSLDQFTHWLDVTTIRQNQPVVFFWLFDVEPKSYSITRSQTESFIDQADSAAQLVGITTAHHLLITPHMLNIPGSDDHEYMMNHQEICSNIANERDNVSAASIYGATDGVLFDGSPESVDWLELNGFTHFEFGSNEINLVNKYGGNLLDSAKIHPNSKDSAAFFASILGNIIREAGCPADLKPDGLIDIEDLLLFFDGWGVGGLSDINNDGTANITDLLLLIDGWGDCWPVQAPYNSSAFRAN